MSDLSLPVSMMTGEEHIVGDNANHVSSTIEMINLHKIVDVAIIDEIQMISDPDRGWAWTQAVIGVPAHHVIMTGSIDALSYVVKIAEMTGEELEVIHFERKNPLTVIPQSLSMQNIQEGDAIVAFSRAEVMRLREAFSEANKSVSVIYGALSPEARRAEARRFRNGESKILIATDAIAMGLNMPIHRVIFSALEKFDGKQVRPLYASEIRQIAGRAGRYGLAEKGEVGVLSGMLSNRIANALSAKPTEIKDNRLFVMPPWRAIEMVALALQTDNLCYILKHIAENLLNDDPMLIPASLETPLFIAEVLDATSLPLRTKHQYMGYPLEKKSDYSQADLKEWAGNHQNNKPNDYPICFQKSVPDTDLELAQCENTAKRLSAYQWLSLKWPDIYPNYKLASQERQRVNGLIESALKKKVISRACSDCGCAMPSWHRHKTCEECHDAKYRYRHYHNDDDDDDIY